jgi:hypothetical protein
LYAIHELSLSVFDIINKKMIDWKKTKNQTKTSWKKKEKKKEIIESYPS